MFLYLITYEGPIGWDEFDSFVIQAPDVLTAKIMAADKAEGYGQGRIGWKGKKIGTATGRSARIILGSFNAG